MSGDNGKEILDSKGAVPKEGEVPIGSETQKQPEEKRLGVIRIGDRDLKILDEHTAIEIKVLKLEGGKEISRVIAHEFMMVEHKSYMVKLLTDAITMVMKARKRQSMIKLMGEATFNKLIRGSRLKGFLRGKKHG